QGAKDSQGLRHEGRWKSDALLRHTGLGGGESRQPRARCDQSPQYRESRRGGIRAHDRGRRGPVPAWRAGVLRHLDALVAAGRAEARVDTVWLTVDKQYCLTPCGSSTTGFPLNDIYILANKEFMDKNPAAKGFLQAVQIPISDLNAENLLMQNGHDKDA